MASSSLFLDSSDYGQVTDAPTLDWNTFQQNLAPTLYGGGVSQALAGRGAWSQDLGWDLGGKGGVSIQGLSPYDFIGNGSAFGGGQEGMQTRQAGMAALASNSDWRAAVDKALADPNTIYNITGDRLGQGNPEGAAMSAQYQLQNGKLVPIGQHNWQRTSDTEQFMKYGVPMLTAFAGGGLLNNLLQTGSALTAPGTLAGASGGVGSAAGSGLVPGTGGSGLAAGTGGTGLSTAGSSIGAGIGSSIPSAPLLGTGAGAGAAGGYGLASGAGSSLIPGAAATSPYSLAGAGASLTPAAAGATSPYSLAGAGASLTPASSAGGFQSFMDNVLGGAKSIKGLMSSPAGRIGSGLLQMYNASEANDQYKKLRDMYGPNSPYAQQLRKQLERKDAAAGRRSQYGPREVELQARLADMYSRGYPSMNAAMNQRNQMRGQGMGLIFSGLDKSGVLEDAWKGLGGLFGG